MEDEGSKLADSEDTAEEIDANNLNYNLLTPNSGEVAISNKCPHTYLCIPPSCFKARTVLIFPKRGPRGLESWIPQY